MFELTLASTLLLAFGTCLLFTILSNSLRRKSNIPGPSFALPIIGHLHLIGNKPLHLFLNDMSKKYGDIFTLQLGQRETVVLAGHKILEQALVKKSKIFASRPDLAMFRYIRNGRFGFTFYRYSEEYIQNRKLTSQSIHQHSKSHDEINSIFKIEMEKMKSLLDGYVHEKKKIFPMEFLRSVIPSLFFASLFGIHYSYKDEELINIVNDVEKAFLISGAGNPSDLIPILEYLPNSRKKSISDLSLIFENFSINSMKKTSPYKHVIYKQMENSDSQYSLLFRNNVREKTKLLSEIIGGGFETTSVSLTWGFLLLFQREKFVEKCKKELRNCPNDLTVREYHDKAPYFSSVIYEILRYACVIPLGIPRETTDDVTLDKYFIKKGTMVLTHLWLTNRDADIWRFPTIFNPNNFYLPDTNSLDSIALKKLNTFSQGIRQCPGFDLAKKMMFEILRVVITCYDVTVPEMAVELEPTKGLSIKPKIIKIQFHEVK